MFDYRPKHKRGSIIKGMGGSENSPGASGWGTVNTPQSECLTMKPDRRHRRRRKHRRLAQSSGRRESKEGSSGSGVTPKPCEPLSGGSPARFRIPPPDSGVVPFSEKSLSPIKSDSDSSGRVGLPFEDIAISSSSPKPRGETESNATVPTGLADSREPTTASLPDWWKRADAGIAWASRRHL